MRRVSAKWFAILLLMSMVHALLAATTDSITQFGITFQFDSSVAYGQFANGDYYVLAPVVVTSMTPDWNGNTNGWEVNPMVASSQGFIDGIASYDGALRPALPLTLSSACSLVKTIGASTETDGSLIQTAVVLTVLDSEPSGGGGKYFRPPYAGVTKPLIGTNSIRWDLLPHYASVADAPTLATVAANFTKCLRMDHNSATPRWFRPIDAMAGYQPSNTPELNEAMLRLMLNDSAADKFQAFVQFTQHCIDQAYIISLGYRRTDDGHNPNHRVLAAWAAILLDLSDIKTYLETADNFHEDHYLSDGLNGAIWGESGYPESNYWNYIMGLGGSRSLKDPYNYIDGGKLSPTGASYQNIVSQSLKGQALVYQLFPALQNGILANRWLTLSNYSARFVSHGVKALPDPAAPYDGVVENYGITFGPDGLGSFIRGDGRFTAYDGVIPDGGQYKSDFVAAMWDAYWPVAGRQIRATTARIGSIQGR